MTHPVATPYEHFLAGKYRRLTAPQRGAMMAMFDKGEIERHGSKWVCGSQSFSDQTIVSLYDAELVTVTIHGKRIGRRFARLRPHGREIMNAVAAVNLEFSQVACADLDECRLVYEGRQAEEDLTL